MKQHHGMRRWLFPLITIVLSVLITTLAVELCLWVVYPVPFDQYMEWIPDGHIKGRALPLQKFQGAAMDALMAPTGKNSKPVKMHEVAINSLGFRGSEYSWKPAPGTLRLLVFSGSAGFCYHQRQEDTWPGRLQYHLTRMLNMPVEVVNLALPGFDSSNSKINYLFAGRALNPQVAIFYHTWNDLKFFRPLEHSPKIVVFTGMVRNDPLWRRLARKTQIGRRVRNFLLAREQTRPYGETQYTSLSNKEVNPAAPASPAALQWARKNFSDFVMFAHSDQVLPVLVTQATTIAQENLPDKYYSVTELDMVGMTRPVLLESWLAMNRIIKDVSSRQSAIFIDGYNEVPHNFQYLEDSVHLTSEGCEALARVIAEGLVKDERFMDVVRRLYAKKAE